MTKSVLLDQEPTSVSRSKSLKGVQMIFLRAHIAQFKPAPGIRCSCAVCFRPSCIPSEPPNVPLCVGSVTRSIAPPWRVGNPPPQGSSLESGLCCPGLSSLNRPHPPHSQAHHDFAARRLIRNAFAVRERLGDPRVVPGFR